VSVVLAIRTPEGMVTGELQIPRERFELAAFVAELDRAAALEPAPLAQPCIDGAPTHEPINHEYRSSPASPGRCRLPRRCEGEAPSALGA
jgi:hypothetical protein